MLKRRRLDREKERVWTEGEGPWVMIIIGKKQLLDESFFTT